MSSHMNWKLILQLSLFGMAMTIATVFLIPSNIEPLFWLVIFAICAYIIARRCSGRYFLHGLLVSVVNGVWITASHILLFDRYITNHPAEASMMQSMPLPDSPRLMMAPTGPIFGVVSRIVLGLFAVVAARLTRARTNRMKTTAGVLILCCALLSNLVPGSQAQATFISKISLDSGDNIHIAYSDGKVIQPPKEKDQASCLDPAVAEDKQTAGWLVAYG